jgi:hypothetical protein
LPQPDLDDGQEKGRITRGGPVMGGPVEGGPVINILPGSDPQSPMDIVRARLAKDPCSVIGHTRAYLNSGGIECAVCGRPC